MFDFTILHIPSIPIVGQYYIVIEEKIKVWYNMINLTVISTPS